jgi:hypothetical protein
MYKLAACTPQKQRQHNTAFYGEMKFVETAHYINQNSTWEDHWITVDKRGKVRGISKGKII